MNWEDEFKSNILKFFGYTPTEEFRRNLKSILTNFDDNQPRWPKGHPKGGQWMSIDGGSGGVFDISDYPKDAKEITHEMAMLQADYKDITAQMNKNLGEISTGKHAHNKVQVDGNITIESANDIVSNMKNELADYSGYLATDAALRARDYIDSFQESINKGIEDGSLRNVSAKDLDSLGQDNIKKLIHQEVESNRQQFTDHGIRHISGNVLRQKEILRTMQPDITGREELMGDFIMINHDVGYTTPLVREGGLRGIMMSGKHPEFSEKIAKQQKSIWNEDIIFSGSEYDRMTDIIRTHDSTAIDKRDWLKTSARLSDNLALFNGEKLPSMFKYVSGGDKHLIDMGLAAAKNDTASFEKSRKLLYSQIDSSNLNNNLKRDLKAATKEISYLTPKFTMGALAGDITSIGKKGNMLNVKIRYNKYDSFLQQHFDMGQRQTKKFLEDYGITDFSRRKYTIGDIMILEVD